MNDPTQSLNATHVDIALILESSYPFILGGVSAWVHQIIENFPQYTFGLIFLGGSPENYLEGIRYKIPPNVTHFQVHYLFADDEPPPPLLKNFEGNTKGFEKIKTIHDNFRCPHNQNMAEAGDIDLYLNEKTGVSYEQFLYSKASWAFLTDAYAANCEDSSFIDYFWTVKNIHKPLWKIASIVPNFPKTKVVHTISTGYAGLLSFLLHTHYQLPVILTEHGIYTKERRIDIFLSKTFRDDYDIDRTLTESSYLRGLWDRYFNTLAKLCYNTSTPIISLFNAAHELQVEEGAERAKAIVIPNGVDIDRYRKLRRSFDDKMPVICFVGRIVPMKDVKGFIRAIPNVNKKRPDLKFWIIGSTDQDPDYAEECHKLVENICLEEVIEFKLHQNMNDVLPKIQVLVLSALRESMPLVVLESFAAGVPVVVTDVGACKEMVLGVPGEDMALGPAGKVIKVANTSELEQAIIDLVTDKDQWEQMSQSAIKRVERYYDQKTMIERYTKIYEERMR